ncbi:MAG: phosphoethanolamine transferase [Prevotella sp.]|nr:phosphoethanolamine transferase [Prevotella sp.]
MKKIENLLARAFTPIRVNFAFFVFMFLLGYACTQLEVPNKKGYGPYALAPIEMFLDIYVVCLILSFIPIKIRRWIRATMYAILYPVSIIDMYCFVRFGSTLTPTMLLLVGETNSSEASEFFSTYLDWSLLLTPIGLILLLMLAHIVCNIIAARRKTHPAVRHKLTGRLGRIYKKLSPSDKAKVSIGAAAGGILGVLSLILLYNGYTETINNKIATVRLMSYKNIGDVEHELTKKDRANLYLPIYRLAFSVYANKLTAKQVDKLIAGIKDVTVDTCTFRSQHIVFVIGESYNKHHSQLYGYNHETTPRQVALHKKGNLIPFTDVIAPFNLTSFVFKNIFSVHAVGDKGDWCDDPLFPELFRRAGYRVAFITNQFLPQAKEAVYDFSGGFFLNNPILSKAQFDVRNTKLYKFDAGVIRDYDQIVKKDIEQNPDVPRLTILHLKGQHTNYHDRFPKDRKHFNEKDYKKDWPEMSKRCRMLLADYDNATLYNDSIMSEVIKRFEDEDAIVIYMSDHGEEAFGDGMEIFGRNHSATIDFRLAHEEYEIPMWIWYSNEYAKKHPDIVKQVKEACHRPFMTDNISQVLLYLAGIKSTHYRDDYNVLSDEYNTQRPRIIKNSVNYDKLRDEHEKEDKEKKDKEKEQQKRRMNTTKRR